VSAARATRRTIIGDCPDPYCRGGTVVTAGVEEPCEVCDGRGNIWGEVPIDAPEPTPASTLADPQWRDAPGASIADVGDRRLCVQRGVTRSDLPPSDPRAWGWGADVSVEVVLDPLVPWNRRHNVVWMPRGYPYATRDEAKHAAIEAFRAMEAKR
jgi:hypothetical protein